jgi:hypothetical protein
MTESAMCAGATRTTHRGDAPGMVLSVCSGLPIRLRHDADPQRCVSVLRIDMRASRSTPAPVRRGVFRHADVVLARCRLREMADSEEAWIERMSPTTMGGDGDGTDFFDGIGMDDLLLLPGARGAGGSQSAPLFLGPRGTADA